MTSFSKEEDEKIIHYRLRHNMGYAKIAKLIPNKTYRQIRDRYENYLNPAINIHIWSPIEDNILIDKHNQFGNKWITISSFLPTKSPASVKNRFLKLNRKNSPDTSRENQEMNSDRGSFDLDKQLPIPSIQDIAPQPSSDISIAQSNDFTNKLIDQEDLTMNDHQSVFVQCDSANDHSCIDFYKGSTLNGVPVNTSNIINGYNLIEEIGSGSYSSVALAKKLENAELYSAKIIPIQYLKQTKQDHLIYKEIEIMRKINHPNIVKYYEHFLTSDNQYLIIITEYYKNTLFDLVVQDSSSSEEKKKIAQGIVEGVFYLHRNRIAHLDIKIENIMLKGLIPIICDFGFAHDNVSLPESISNATLLYAAPEYFLEPKVDLFKMDIYALGITLYMLATCDADFYNLSDKNAIKMRTINFGISSMINQDDELQRFAQQCTIKDPNQRPTIFTLRNDLFLE